jgi:GT2 family glycosyltransferase
VVKEKMKDPIVSIVILSAFRKACTEKCLNSIDRHVSIDHEIIVVDMGKDDEIVRWLEREQRMRNNLKVIFNPDNVGTSKGRNQGLEEAVGSYVVFLDNDVIVHKDWVEELLKEIKSYSGNAIIGSKLTCFNEYVYYCGNYIYDKMENGVRSIGLKVTKPLFSKDRKVNIKQEVPWYPTCSMLAEKEALAALGGFDERLMFVEEDKDICYRFREKGGKVVYCPSSQAIHDRTFDEYYNKNIRYKHLQQIKKDIRFFEFRWKCRVELTYSRECLEFSGYSKAMIEDMQIGPLKEFFTVV